MSGTKSAIDTMTAEDTALMDTMRDDTPTPDVVETQPAPDAAEIELDLDTAPDAEDVADTTTKQTRMVPHAQLHAINERRKAAEERARTAELKLATETATVNERLRLIGEAMQTATAPAAAPTVEIPDINTDPVGHFQAQLAETRKVLADQAAIIQGFTETQRQQQARAEMVNWAQGQEREFMAKETTYNEAMEFLKNGRHAELEAIGINDPNERNRIIAGDVTQIAAKSRQDGVNFAERLYNLSVKRGFTKTPAAPVVPAIDADAPLPDRAARAETGRQNATTLAGVGAAAPPRLSPEKIASLSDGAFDAIITKMREGNSNALKDLMGH